MIHSKMIVLGMSYSTVQLFRVLEAKLDELLVQVPYTLRADISPQLSPTFAQRVRVGDELNVRLNNHAATLNKVELVSFEIA